MSAHTQILTVNSSDLPQLTQEIHVSHTLTTTPTTTNTQTGSSGRSSDSRAVRSIISTKSTVTHANSESQQQNGTCNVGLVLVLVFFYSCMLVDCGIIIGLSQIPQPDV